MANLQKFTRANAGKILRHNERKNKKPANKSIDPAKTHLNYSLMPDGKTSWRRYTERLDELYCYNRPDVNTLCSWAITAPKTLEEQQREAFFLACRDFVADRYGEENMVQAQVHLDETTPHIHIAFIPATEDPKHGGEKVCANIVNNRMDLVTFHHDLEKALLERGIRADVYTGVTKEQGGNRSIEELKAEHNKEVEKEDVEAIRQIDDDCRCCDDPEHGDNITVNKDRTDSFDWRDFVPRAQYIEYDQDHEIEIERS